MTAVLLLDEELAVLLPGAGPLPWLDTSLEPDAGLTTAARGLLLRGTATWDGTALRAHGELARLLALRAAPGPVVTLTPMTGGADTVLVVRPGRDGGLLLHETAGDGTHLLEDHTPDALTDALLAGLPPPQPGTAPVLLLALSGAGERVLAVGADHAVTVAEDGGTSAAADLRTVLHGTLAALLA